MSIAEGYRQAERATCALQNGNTAMKTLALLTSAALALSFAGAPLAQTTLPGSGGQGATNNANCFGQARSEGAKTAQPMGQVIRERAQSGTNAEQNAAFREACQTSPGATPPVQQQPNNANCFGQARSEGAKTAQPMGQVIRERAQAGTNAEQNAAFKEACQTAPVTAPGE